MNLKANVLRVSHSRLKGKNLQTMNPQKAVAAPQSESEILDNVSKKREPDITHKAPDLLHRPKALPWRPRPEFKSQ